MDVRFGRDMALVDSIEIHDIFQEVGAIWVLNDFVLSNRNVPVS